MTTKGEQSRTGDDLQALFVCLEIGMHVKPVLRPIYLDYQASTPLCAAAWSRMKALYETDCANPHSANHAAGWKAAAIVETAREEVATLIGSDEDEIVFTSGASEANNLAILGLARGNETGRKRVLLSATEHKCVLAAGRQLEAEGYIVEHIPVNQFGLVDVEKFKSMLSDDVLLVSVMTVNNEVGTIQDIKALVDISHGFGALFHTDAAQAPVTLKLDVLESGVDLLSLSAHKMYGPKGIGALFVRRDIKDRIQPIIFGGGQEYGLRGGSLPTQLCAGFGSAAGFLQSNFDETVEKTKSLRDRFWGKLTEAYSDIVLIGSDLDCRHAGNLSIYLPRIVSSDHLIQMLQPNVAISSGSACSSGFPEPSHVIAHICSDEAAWSRTVRVSFGYQLTAGDVDAAVEHLLSKLSL
ncbi:MAG: cysteine desulfurase [Gammaproteobacteria bacterium]|nr:cysteine desulfurase [Gammaproteobacteria bacterium]